MPDAEPFPRTPSPRLEEITLEEHGLRLEPLRNEHVAPLAELVLADPGIWQWFTTEPSSLAVVLGAIQNQIDTAHATGLSLPFTVVDVASGRLLGNTTYLDYRPLHRGIEIGWTWYVRSAWGTTVNPTAKWLLLRNAFEQLGCARVQLKTDERNLRSRAAIARLGAKEEGTLRKHQLTQGGHLRNTVFFSILAEEWPTVQQRLMDRIVAPQRT